MNVATNFAEDEEKVTANAMKTAFYLYDALKEGDFDSAQLELTELVESFKILEDFQIKRERREKLTEVVLDMKRKGIRIDFASRSALLKQDAKNAGEKGRRIEKDQKKWQYA